MHYTWHDLYSLSCLKVLVTENYLVYVPEIKFTSYIKNEEKLEKFKEYKFTMHIFNDEFSLKQKVRLQLVL